MTILITGSSNWTDGHRLVKKLLEFEAGTTLIEGGAEGADRMASQAGKALGFRIITVAAEWRRYGHGAGPIRNRKMLDMKPDLVLAFCKNHSRGTMDCVGAALERNIPVELIDE